LGYARHHALDMAAIALNTSDAQAGYWESATKTFFTDGQTVLIGDAYVTLAPSTTAQYYNAVRVAASADAAAGHNAPLGVWCGGFLGGARTMTLGARAVAVGGGPCSNSGCTLPLVVPSCALLDGGGNIACGTVVRLYFNHGHGKDVALADVLQ